jgi:elongation factor Ts
MNLRLKRTKPLTRRTLRQTLSQSRGGQPRRGAAARQHGGAAAPHAASSNDHPAAIAAARMKTEPVRTMDMEEGQTMAAPISAAAVKALRERTSAGIMECRNALEETGGDTEKAVELLRQRGIMKAGKKADREAKQGLVESYIHGGGRIGVLVELNCETDFVARTEGFRALARDIAMQVAAMAPRYVGPDERPADIDGNDPENLALLEQPFIRDPKKTIGDLVKENIATVGENIVVRRFVRYELGQGE